MNVAQLAQAVAELARAKPEFDATLAAVLNKWLVDTFFKAPHLAALCAASQRPGGSILVEYARGLKPPEAAKLAKKLDPLVSKEILADRAAVSLHLCDLLTGKRGLSERSATKSTAKVPTIPFGDILKLHDSEARRRELDRMKPADLKKAIKEKQLDHLMLPAKASKLEMVEHIESALAAGWPQPRGILHPSQG